jgi:hypothetical protein
VNIALFPTVEGGTLLPAEEGGKPCPTVDWADASAGIEIAKTNSSATSMRLEFFIGY